MVLARQLYDLQQSELDLRQRQQALQGVQARLQDRHELDEARSRTEAATKRHRAAHAELRDAELALQQLVQRIQETDQRLYAGGTTNPKELVNLQEDSRMLGRQRQAQESRVLELMGQTEEAAAAVSSAEGHLRQADEAWQRGQEQLLREQEQLAQDIHRLQERTEQAAAALNGRELGLYESLKKVRAGRAVARVERGICLGCGVALPSRDLQRARASQELVRCNSCGRILYVGLAQA